MRSRNVLLLLALALPAHATSLSQTSIWRFARGSDLIFVGKVLRVVKVPAGERGHVLVAEAEPLEWIKGAVRPKRLWYLAEGTRDADLATAFEGEKVLLFLHTPKERIEGFDLDIAARLEEPSFWKGVKELTGGAPLRTIDFNGYGRMPLDHVEGVEYAEVSGWLVRIPPDMNSIPSENPVLFDNDRRVPLADLIALVKRILAPVPRPKNERVAKMLTLLAALDTDIEKADAMRGELDKKDIAVLIEMLDDPAFPRRYAAAEALFWIEDPGFEALREALVSKNVVRRRGAAFAFEWGALLDDVDQEEITPDAVEAVGRPDPDPEFRARMVAALARNYMIDENEAVDAAVKALKDESLRVLRSAARTLGRLRYNTSEDVDFVKVEVALLAFATDENVHLRREVWDSLYRIAGPKTLARALAALEDPDRVVRVNAIRVLGRIDDPKAVKRLIGLVGSDDRWARRTAIAGIGEGKAAAAVGALIKALGDPDEVIVEAAIDALRDIGPPAAAAIPALERLLKSRHSERVEDTLKKIRKK